ncbi:ImmA/IrrE family metallo-endopeptidase [Micromonospora lupini]|uniref:ImmA/IrrE family metallo-endopeptidase n=1 Tax=Micromonospora lupini TaxID=285679 RepID=UPI002256A8DA|nr:ImmA/IrrE family metallo-endopeptidase [Micromonospora lupini]MCX5070814.1 ImmA/IrrE family metallo-endopeptidase [Micromonospora lupini]
MVGQIARLRGRTIQLIPAEMHGMHGLWVATPRADYIAYPARSGPFKRAGVVLHEIAHMVLEHPSRDLAELEGLISESPYNRHHEVEANEFAAAILHRADSPPAPPQPVDQDLLCVIDTFGSDTPTYDLHGTRGFSGAVRRRLHRIYPARW